VCISLKGYTSAEEWDENKLWNSDDWFRTQAYTNFPIAVTHHIETVRKYVEY